MTKATLHLFFLLFNFLFSQLLLFPKQEPQDDQTEEGPTEMDKEVNSFWNFLFLNRR